MEWYYSHQTVPDLWRFLWFPDKIHKIWIFICSLLITSFPALFRYCNVVGTFLWIRSSLHIFIDYRKKINKIILFQWRSSKETVTAWCKVNVFSQSFQWAVCETVSLVFLWETKCSHSGKSSHMSQHFLYSWAVHSAVLTFLLACTMDIWCYQFPRLCQHCHQHLLRMLCIISSRNDWFTGYFPPLSNMEFHALVFYGIPSPIHCLELNSKSIKINRNLFLLAQLISGYFVCI